MRFFNMLLMAGCTWIAGSMQGATSTNRAVMVGATGALVAPTAAAFASTNGLVRTNDLAAARLEDWLVMSNLLYGATNRLVNTNTLRLATNAANVNATNLVRSATNGVARTSQLIAATNGVAYRMDMLASNSFNVYTATITTNLSAELISNGDFSAGGDGWSSATWTFGVNASWSFTGAGASADLMQSAGGDDADYLLVWYGAWTTNTLGASMGGSAGGLPATASAGEWVTNVFGAGQDGTLTFNATSVENDGNDDPVYVAFVVDNVSLKRIEYTTNWALMFGVNSGGVFYGTNLMATWTQVLTTSNALFTGRSLVTTNVAAGTNTLYVTNGIIWRVE
jgi:hypothetical protein